MSSEPTVRSEPDPAAFLSIRGVTKRFGELVAVDELSLDVIRGELVSFVGPSGCGKTTLLRMLGGFLRQDQGSIVLDGQPIDDLPPERRPTGMVFQAYALFPHLTVAQNVAYGLDVRGVDRGERQQRVADALEMVQLTGKDDRKPNELSGGQQQRVALARCLVLRPKVLLLDEPLSNLDANLRVVMRDEIRRLKDELDLTVVFVTHDQEEALSISDRLLVLRDGRVQQVGHPSE
ncbi:MAG: ABC transporter ATP-binding protein, partial [Nitriliruptoraceae bacterium]